MNRTITILAILAAWPLFADVTVAPDGSGQFKSIQQAIDSAPDNSTSRFIIHIKPGIYKEHIVIPHAKRFITLAGEDAEHTILTFDLYANVAGPDGKPIGTFRTPSVMIQTDDFTAEKLTFANSAGDKGHTNGQAVALAIFGDRGVFRDCRFLGWQDTLLVQTGRQYFENCYIEGAVDYIFGASTVWFENCRIHSIGNGYITAASTPQDQPHGYVFSHCKITGEPGVKSYLGRPWRDYANVVFMNSEMSDVVPPEGWHNWDKTERDKTARYAEYHNTGAGAKPEQRLAWTKQITDTDAAKLTIANVLGGIDGWDPKAGTLKTAIRLDPAAHIDPPRRQPGLFMANSTKGIQSSRDGLLWRVAQRDFPPAVALISAKQMRAFWIEKNHFMDSAWSPLSLPPKPRELFVDVREDALDVERPGGFYDRDANLGVLWWTSTIGANYVQSYEEPVDDNPRLWCVATSDFKIHSTPKMLFDPAYPSRYAAMIKFRGRYALVHEDSRAAIQGLRVAFSDSLSGPWGPSSGVLPRCNGGPVSVVHFGDAAAIYARNCMLVTRDFLTFADATNRLQATGEFTSMIGPSH